jgi:hypothetical protein
MCKDGRRGGEEIKMDRDYTEQVVSNSVIKVEVDRELSHKRSLSKLNCRINRYKHALELRIICALIRSL